MCPIVMRIETHNSPQSDSSSANVGQYFDRPCAALAIHILVRDHADILRINAAGQNIALAQLFADLKRAQASSGYIEHNNVGDYLARVQPYSRDFGKSLRQQAGIFVVL